MTIVPPVSPGWIAATGITLAALVLLPLGLALYARRRLGVGWRYFGYGALIFLLFQLLTRVPAVTAAQAALAPALRASPLLNWAWLAVLALTAGLFEEVGRYVGYRWLMGREEKTWAKAVLYGLGHGGIESILLVGGAKLATLVAVLTLTPAQLEALPPEGRAAAQQQLAAIAAQPGWFPLLTVWERLGALALHVALAVVVLQVFVRGSLAWLGLAIGAHAGFDFLAVAALQLFGPSGLTGPLLAEALVGGLGALALWTALRLRPP